MKPIWTSRAWRWWRVRWWRLLCWIPFDGHWEWSPVEATTTVLADPLFVLQCSSWSLVFIFLDLPTRRLLCWLHIFVRSLFGFWNCYFICNFWSHCTWIIRATRLTEQRLEVSPGSLQFWAKWGLFDQIKLFGPRRFWVFIDKTTSFTWIFKQILFWI